MRFRRHAAPVLVTFTLLSTRQAAVRAQPTNVVLTYDSAPTGSCALASLPRLLKSGPDRGRVYCCPAGTWSECTIGLVVDPAACTANLYVTDLNASGALTCSAITDAAVPDAITASNYLLKSGDIMSGDLIWTTDSARGIGTLTTSTGTVWVRTLDSGTAASIGRSLTLQTWDNDADATASIVLSGGLLQGLATFRNYSALDLNAARIDDTADVKPNADNTRDLGSPALRYNDLNAVNVASGASTLAARTNDASAVATDRLTFTAGATTATATFSATDIVMGTAATQETFFRATGKPVLVGTSADTYSSYTDSLITVKDDTNLTIACVYDAACGGACDESCVTLNAETGRLTAVYGGSTYTITNGANFTNLQTDCNQAIDSYLQVPCAGGLNDIGGSYGYSTTQVGNTAGTLTTLASTIIQPNSLSFNGDSLHYECAGTFAATASTDKQVRVDLASTVLFDTGALAITTANDWSLTGRCIRTGSASQKCITRFHSSSTVLNSTVDYVAGTVNLAASQTLACKGKGTNANDVVGEMWYVHRASKP